MPLAIDEHRSEIDRLCLRFGVARLDIFGSAVGEASDVEHVDVDLLVEFIDPAASSHADDYFGLSGLRLGRFTLEANPREIVRQDEGCRGDVEANEVPHKALSEFDHGWHRDALLAAEGAAVGPNQPVTDDFHAARRSDATLIANEEASLAIELEAEAFRNRERLTAAAGVGGGPPTVEICESVGSGQSRRWFGAGLGLRRGVIVAAFAGLGVAGGREDQRNGHQNAAGRRSRVHR